MPIGASFLNIMKRHLRTERSGGTRELCTFPLGGNSSSIDDNTIDLQQRRVLGQHMNVPLRRKTGRLPRLRGQI